MSKTAASQPLLQLLVRLYNQPVQSYYHFPEVIIYGSQRLEKNDFDLLLKEGFIESYYADSFGRLYRLSKKAEYFLQESLHKRRHKSLNEVEKPKQVSLPFLEGRSN